MGTKTTTYRLSEDDKNKLSSLATKFGLTKKNGEPNSTAALERLIREAALREGIK